MTREPLTVVGDALLDVDLEGDVERLCPDAAAPVVDRPRERARPGGAALAATLAARDGRAVTLVTALASDPPGRRLAELLAGEGVRVVDVRLEGSTPEKVRVRADGRSLVRIDRGGHGRVGPWTAEARDALASARAVLVSDYGRGIAGAAASSLGTVPPHVSVVWDPHPRGAAPPPGMRLVTPNRQEAAVFAETAEREHGGVVELASVTARARSLLRRWRCAGVAVTLGARGAVLVEGDGLPFVVPGRPVPRADPCGAGDRFAATAAGLLADGALPSESVAGAVASATDFVACGGAAGLGAPEPSAVQDADAPTVVETVRANGGTVVATSGCFDLLHAGHVSFLEAARALGDCLIVYLNSDDSVRRLKGPDRPLTPLDDRARVLRSLGSVDAVVVFDEDTPEAALRGLRPDVFAKGGDYAVGELPEAGVMSSWGGQAVVLPYVEGRSTSRLLEEVRRGAR